MITLNLISPEYKKTITIKRIFASAQNIILYITFFVILAAIILLIARKNLDENFLEELERTSLISSTPQGSKKNIEINKKIQLAQKVQSDYIPWSKFLIRFSKLIPNNVVVNTLNIVPLDAEGKKDGWKINFSGLSKNRNDFLDLKDNILRAEKDGLFAEVNIPRTILFKKENIDFNINLTIKKDTLTGLSF